MAVYLLHLNTKLSHAQHYIGWSTENNVKNRFAHHCQGHGSRFTQVCIERGIELVLARIWKGKDKNFERHLKSQNNSARFCPICNPKTAMNSMKE